MEKLLHQRPSWFRNRGPKGLTLGKGVVAALGPGVNLARIRLMVDGGQVGTGVIASEHSGRLTGVTPVLERLEIAADSAAVIRVRVGHDRHGSYLQFERMESDSRTYQHGFGHISNVPIGTTFENRLALVRASIHRELQKGIWGGPSLGAKSIVVSGGYEDDLDHGETLLYTGEGGRDPITGYQIADQSLTTKGNAALLQSCRRGLPVRVIRGPIPDSPFAPRTGFRYDGLYVVDSAFQSRGKSGYLMCMFELRRVDDESAPWNARQHDHQRKSTVRTPTTIHRVIRDTPTATRIKELYGYTCQVCGLGLHTPAGPYSEAAHIRPLGSPHDGPDVPDNILSLCPNHHVQLDRGGIAIADDLTLIGMPGILTLKRNHRPSADHLRYHRTLFGYG